jgi:ribose/xylose/arabinose/galactoside ABC-type transport system permease subunit
MSIASPSMLKVGRGISPQLLVGAGVFVAVVLFMLVRSPVFFMPGNIVNVLVQTGMLAILATAMTVVMVGGGIDLSLPANMALAGVVGSMAMIQFDSVALGCVVMVAAASLVGAVNGFAVAYLRMIPFVVTLATMTMCGGLSVWLTNSVSISDQPSVFFDVLLAKPIGVPVPIMIMAAVVAVMQFILVATRFGFQLYAVGTNLAASSISRVPVRRVLFRTYLVAGFLAGIAAIVVTARLGSASANVGNDSVTLDIITACVIGGVSIYGGVGRPLGALFGAIFVLVLGNVLNLLGISFFLGLMLKGVIIIALVAGDRAFSRRIG